MADREDRPDLPRVRPEQYGGHRYGDVEARGGSVHLGDNLFITDVQHRRRLSTEWEARPVLHGAVQDDDHLYIVPKHSSFQFTGRHTETTLIERYFSSPLSPTINAMHKIAVLYGLGGSGKTQVCLRYAETFQRLYWGVFWIDVSTVANAEAGYAYLAQHAGEGNTWMAGKYWLSQCIRPWLLILDNADDPSLDLTNYFPTGGNGHILITTRLQDFRIFATVGHIKFDKMEPEEAIDLLLKAAYPEDRNIRTLSESRTLAGAIARELGHLAIALNQAGATIRRKIYTLEKYLRSYLGKRHRLLNSKSIAPEEIDVIATWEIPFKRIETTQIEEHRDAVDLIHVFAFLHFESIPEELFQRVWTTTIGIGTDHSDLPALLKPSTTSLEEIEARFKRGIGVLAGYSIIEHDANGSRYSLHPVVHEWAKSRIGDNQAMEFWLRCTLYILSCSAAPEVSELDSKHRMSILPHVDSCLDLIIKRAPSIIHTKYGIDQVELLVSLYEANGHWQKALGVLKIISDIRLDVLGRRHEDYFRVQRSMARCHWNLFEVKRALDIHVALWQARWYLRPSLLDWRHPWRPDHLSYCIALDDLTQTLWLVGQKERSRAAGRRAVQGLAKRLGDNDHRVWNAMFNLGRTLRHLGDTTTAHKLLSFVVRRRKSSFGRNHPETLMARNELGMNFWARKQYLNIAEKLVTNVYEARKTVLGRDHAYTLWSANDLSKILCTRGCAQQALELLQGILPTVELTLGRDHVGMLMTKGNLARAHAFCGHWVDAEVTLLEILGSIDDDHPDWFQCMYGYVRVETELDHIAQAEESCQKMLEKFAPDKHRLSAFRTTMELLANVYVRSSRAEKMEELKRRHTWLNMNNVEKPPLLL